MKSSRCKGKKQPKKLYSTPIGRFQTCDHDDHDDHVDRHDQHHEQTSSKQALVERTHTMVAMTKPHMKSTN